MIMTYKNAIPAICLVAALAMAPVAPEASNFLFLIAGAAGMLTIWPDAIAEFRRPVVWMPLTGLTLIGVAYILSSGLSGLEGLLYFSPLLVILPLVTLLRGVPLGPLSFVVGLLAFCGVAGAAVMAIFEVLETGTPRAGEMVANPIHFADVALLVGFVCPIGVVASRNWRQVFFLVAPFVSLIPVFLSGTRGAIVAMAGMLIVSATTAALVRLISPKLVLLISLGLIVIATLALPFGADQVSGVQRVAVDIASILTHGVPTDVSTDLRFQMFQGGWLALLESPFFGHGPRHFASVANSLVQGTFADTPHLHSDPVNLIASAGAMGLVAYGLILLAPIVEALTMSKGRQRSWATLLATTFISGFFVMGLTNAMFGILTITVTFAAFCAIVGFLSKASPTEAQLVA
jgi:O-antigen ligase